MAQAFDTIKIAEMIRHYKILQVIGSGGFAIIVQAYDTKQKRDVAIKIISRAAAQKNDYLLYLERELRLCIRFSHPNIVKVFEIIYEPDTIMIVMEYIPKGDLHMIANHSFQISSKLKIKIAEGILNGLNYLHSRGICHRDIKLDNILLDENYNPKIIDFGLSRENPTHLETICGTENYMAPEILVNTKSYDGKKADIWSFGVLFYALMNGRYPWNEDFSNTKHLKKIIDGTIQINIPQEGIAGMILKSTLIVDPNERCSSEQLLEMIHSYKIKYECHTGISKIRNCKRGSIPKLSIRTKYIAPIEPHLTPRMVKNLRMSTLWRKSI